MDPKVSIIMSVLNGEKYVRKGIESIINQSFTDWEFIICDDGSSDGTMKILQKYAEKDKRFIILRNDSNMGLAYSLNRCIEIARSDILARQDADDESLPTRLAVQYEFVKTHSEYAIVGTAWYSVNQDTGESNLCIPLEKPTAKQMVWLGSFMHPSWMMQKKRLQRVGFYTTGKLTMRDQDYHLVMKLLSVGESIYNLREPLYLYTDDASTFNRTKNWGRVKGLMWVRYDSYKRNKLPLWCYVGVLKPLIKMLLPNCVTKMYYYSAKRKR